MDDLQVLDQKALLLERHDMAAVVGRRIEMDGDRDAELARSVVLFAIDRLRQRAQFELAVRQPEGRLHATPTESEREQALVGKTRPIAMKALDIVGVDRLGRRHAARRTVAEA